MSRRRTPHPSLTPKRALALLLTVVDESLSANHRLAQSRNALAEHVNAALDRKPQIPDASDLAARTAHMLTRKGVGGGVMRPPLERAATLRRYAARVISQAEYLETVRAPADAELSAEAHAADLAAREAFAREPGARDIQMRIEYEAELYEAVDNLRSQLSGATRLRRYGSTLGNSLDRATFDLIARVVKALMGAR